MLRKVLLIAAATAMPLSFIAAVGGSAGATSKVDATNATVACNGISGSVKIKPAISANEVAGPSKITIKATLSGCTTSDGVTVTKASVAGTLTSTRTAGENGCAELAEGTGGSGESGTLTTKWTTTPKLSSGNSVIHPTSFTGTLLTSGPDSGYVTFAIPGATPNGAPSGSFQGTNAGASDATTGLTKETGAALITSCESKKGLSTIDLTTAPSPPSVTLG